MRYLVAKLTLLLFLASPALAQTDRLAGDRGVIGITPLIHSSVQLTYQGRVIQIDPWNRLGLTGAEPADLILITDNVGHHLDVSALQKLRKPWTPVVIAANGLDQIPGGRVLANGERTSVAGIDIEAVAAYDIIPGEPSHPKGEANGYVVELGGRRLYFAGVTECVAEVRALQNIDVAFLPMNVPLGRMTPAAVAECARDLDVDVLYPYHYDQDYARRALNPGYVGPGLPGGLSVEETLDLLRDLLRDSGIEVRLGAFYPPLD